MNENYKPAKILDDTDLQDGLENLVANLGTKQDKRSAARFVNQAQLLTNEDATEINAMYRTDWISGKVVDIVPDDMTREWREFTADGLDPKVKEQLEEEEDRLGLATAFNLAHKWSRLYGTAFIVLDVNDGKKADQPLDITALKEGCLRHIKVVDRFRMSHDGIVELNPLDPNFGFPKLYTFRDTQVKIHHTRLLRFDAVLLPFDEFKRNNYWSDSVLPRLYDAILNFSTATNSAASMIYEANVDIVKVKGFMNYLQTTEGEERLRKRFALANTLKSFNAMMLLDSEEEHQTKTNSFSGLPDLIDRFTQVLAAGSDIVATRFLGISAAGFSTGENDLKNYYDMIKSKQNSVYKQKLVYVDKIIRQSLGLPEDTNLKFVFKTLFQLTEVEIADMRLKDAQRDQIYLDSGVIRPSMVAKELKSVDTYGSISDEYIEELEQEEEDASLANAFNIVTASEGEKAETGNDPEANRSAVQKSFDKLSKFFSRKY